MLRHTAEKAALRDGKSTVVASKANDARDLLCPEGFPSGIHYVYLPKLLSGQDPVFKVMNHRENKCFPAHVLEGQTD